MLLSIFIHGIGIIILIFYYKNSIAPNLAEVNEKKGAILVELKDISKNETLKTERLSAEKTQRKKVNIKSRPPLNNLKSLSINNSLKISSETSINSKSPVGLFGDNTGLSTNLKEGDNSVYHYLYQYIGSNIYYPKIFRKKEIEGYVTVRVVFDKKGNYQENLTKIRSNSGYLRVLTARSLRRMFKGPLPFNLSFNKHKYFLVDATFRFNADSNSDEDFILSNTFISGRHLGFLIQDESASMIGFRKNTEGMLKLGINYGDIVDWVKENFTATGKVRKMFNEQQLERYKDDPSWTE